MDQIEQIWKNSGYAAAGKLWSIVKAKGIIGIKQKDVIDFVKNQEVNQLHKPAPTNIRSEPIVVAGKNLELTMDLLDMQSFSAANGGLRWILLVESIWSRKLAARGIKSKQPSDVLPALKECVAEIGEEPLQITCDAGGEWKGGVGEYLDSKGILLNTVNTAEIHKGSHVLGVINALSKTVKNGLYKHFTYTGKTNWNDYLPTLVESYNSAPNGALKLPGYSAMSPDEAAENETATRMVNTNKLEKAHENPASPLKVGDHVRILKKKQIFQRGFQVRYSKVVYKIVAVDGLWFELSDGRKFRAGSLQKVPEPKVAAALAANEENEEEHKEEAKPPLAPGRNRSKSPVQLEQKEWVDPARQAHRNHRSKQIVKHQEGLDVANINRRNTLRERKPVQLIHDLFGRINW